MVKLDDLDLGHVLRGLGGEAHRQDGADREVGHDEDVRLSPARGLAHLVVVESGGADDDVRAGVDRGADVARARRRES